MFNDDFSDLTGGLGDLNGDGRVDFDEFMNEEDDFCRIFGEGDNDFDEDSDDGLDGDFDDDFDGDDGEF